MRILVVSQYFWPENFRINDLVAELAARGHQVTVLTGKPNYPDGWIFEEFRLNSEKYNAYSGAKVVRVPLIPRGSGGSRLVLNYLSFAFSAALLGPLRLWGQKFDTIFVYEPSPITVGLPAIALRFFKKAPVAFWVLDLWPETLEAMGVVRSKWMMSVVDRLVKFIYRRCDVILAQSEGFISRIARHVPANTRILYFPSWAENAFPISQAEAAPEVERKPQLFNVLFAGNIGEAQDFPSILNAALTLRDKKVRWLIVGDGRKAAWLQREVTRLGLKDSVVLLGRVPLERMPSFYKHAQALLVALEPKPVFSLTIPAKVQSYLACGIPILAMIDGEGADLIRRSGAGLVCRAGDSIGLAENTLRMAKMPAQMLADMGANGIRLSTSEFDRDHLISSLEALLGELRHHHIRRTDK